MTGRIHLTLLGHKDHGKSTLVGRLLYDTRSVSEGRIEEARNASRQLGLEMEYAFLLDSFEEEREGGMTMDVIHAQIRSGQRLYNLVDVPGHQELIRNMLTGASMAEAGILIVSAQEGLQEQTGQHLRLAKWLGLERLLVAINKMDCVGYQQKAFEDLLSQVKDLLKISGYDGDAMFVPISAYQGDNVTAVSELMPWYKGQSLLQMLEELRAERDLTAGPFRMPVQDIYKSPEGPVIAGRIESGQVNRGDTVLFQPSGKQGVIKNLMVSSGSSSAAATGENIGMVLEQAGFSVSRGEVCSDPNHPADVVQEIVVDAIFLDLPPEKVLLECGRAESHARLKSGANISVGEVCRVHLAMEESMVVGSWNTSLGRLAIRDQGKIIGVARAV